MRVAANCQQCGEWTIEVHMIEKDLDRVLLLCEKCCPACREAIPVLTV